MNSAPWSLPSPLELDLHPELGPLCLLDYSLALTIRCLWAVYPEFSEPDFLDERPQPASTRIARCLAKQLGLLCELLPEYRAVLAEEDFSPPPPPRSDATAPF